MKNYTALIIDIVNSKKLDSNKRFEVQEKLSISIKILNEIYKDSIYKSLSFSAGDSVQGLFLDTKTAYEIYYFIKQTISPFNLRAGIGVGSINEVIAKNFNINDSNVFDGKAYHMARNAIDACEEKKSNIIIFGNKDTDDMLNTLIKERELNTTQRQVLFSICSLVPYLRKIEKKSEIFPLFAKIVLNLSDYYKGFSKNNIKSEKSALNILEVSNIINKNIFSDSSFFENSENYSNISTNYRTLLVDLLKTSEQNINSIIKSAKISELMTEHFAKYNLVTYLYKGDKEQC